MTHPQQRLLLETAWEALEDAGLVLDFRLREACAAAAVDPAAIGYVEAHGTGPAVGDPIEAHALSEALCAGRSPEAPLLIGSVKTITAISRRLGSAS